MNDEYGVFKISQKSAVYRKIKSEYMDMFRDKVFSRDGNKCAACGMDEVSRLNLAHITSTLSFVRRFNKEVDLRTSIMLSFRDDNLITLCGTCHRMQHGKIDSTYSPEISKKMEEVKTIVNTGGSAKEYLELKKELNDLFDKAREEGSKRKKKVNDLFDRIKEGREWDNAGQLELAGNKETGYSVTLKENFVALKKGCYIPTGPHRVASKEGKECGYKATCRGEFKRCRDCGYYFCEYHFPRHKASAMRYTDFPQ